MAEWLKATDCKSVLTEYDGSNPSLPTISKKQVSSKGGTFALQTKKTAERFHAWQSLLIQSSIVHSTTEVPFNSFARLSKRLIISL